MSAFTVHSAAMIALATMLGVAQSRGQNLFAWFLGYMAVVAIAVFLAVITKSLLVVVIIESLFTLTFLLSYHLYSDETKAKMRKNTDVDTVVNTKQEKFYASLAEWEVVKVYVDSSQQRELLNDRERLDCHQIRSFVKTAGITTMMVHRDHLEKASELLGIVPLDGPEAAEALEKE